MGYLEHLETFLDDSDQVISSFKTIQNNTANLNGGAGNLSSAMDDISARIRAEEQKKIDAEAVLKQSVNFTNVTEQVDQQVAVLVNQNRDQFYHVNPHLMPPATEEEKGWLEQAWDNVKQGFKEAGEKIKEAFTAIGDTLKKGWDNLVEFYQEHKKIIDTILAVAGAVLAIAAVVASGGLALVPLLGALGCSVGVATAISMTVAVAAVVTTVLATSMNVADIWFDIDNPTFQAWKNGLTIASGVLNFAYSIGNIYNSVKGVTPKEYIAREHAKQIDYSSIGTDHPNIKVENGRDYSARQKDLIYEHNKEWNNGVIRDDIDGKQLVRQGRSQAGQPKPINGAEIDHHFPQSKGGANSFENAKVVNWQTNNIKRARIDLPDNFHIDSVPDIGSIPDALKNLFTGNFQGLDNLRHFLSK